MGIEAVIMVVVAAVGLAIGVGVDDLIIEPMLVRFRAWRRAR